MAPSPHDGDPVSNPDQYVTFKSLEGNESGGAPVHITVCFNVSGSLLSISLPTLCLRPTCQFTAVCASMLR